MYLLLAFGVFFVAICAVCPLLEAAGVSPHFRKRMKSLETTRLIITDYIPSVKGYTFFAPDFWVTPVFCFFGTLFGFVVAAIFFIFVILYMTVVVLNRVTGKVYHSCLPWIYRCWHM